MPNIYFLIGVPCSGKSTFRDKFINNTKDVPPVVISSDDFIDTYASERSLTYSEVFKEAVSLADKKCKENFAIALNNNYDIIIDRTNLTRAGRKKFIDQLPEGYYIHGFVFKITDEEFFERNNKRSKYGKFIPTEVYLNMKKIFEYPNINEGFSNIKDFAT